MFYKILSVVFHSQFIIEGTRTYSAGDNNISISFDIKHSHFERSEIQRQRSAISNTLR